MAQCDSLQAMQTSPNTADYIMTEGERFNKAPGQYLLFFFFFGSAHPGHVEVMGQGLNLHYVVTQATAIATLDPLSSRPPGNSYFCYISVSLKDGLRKQCYL